MAPTAPAPVEFFTSDSQIFGTTDVCGFPVDYAIEIHVKARGFPPEQGHGDTNVVNYQVDWTVSGNGKTVSYHEAYTETFFPSPKFPDLIVIRAQHGLTFAIRLDRSGMIIRDAGTLLFLPGGVIVRIDGQHPTELAGGSDAAIPEICGALAGP